MAVATRSEQEQNASPWEATVSAWVDAEGDLRTEDLDSPYGRHVWDTYHLIGDVLRSEDLAIRPSDLFYARVSRAIDAEPAIVAPHVRKYGAVRMGLSGLVVAAAMVSVVWVALPYFSAVGTETPVQVMASTAESAGGRDTEAGLRDYLDAHRQIAGVSPVRQASFDMGAPR